MPDTTDIRAMTLDELVTWESALRAELREVVRESWRRLIEPYREFWPLLEAGILRNRGRFDHRVHFEASRLMRGAPEFSTACLWWRLNAKRVTSISASDRAQAVLRRLMSGGLIESPAGDPAAHASPPAASPDASPRPDAAPGSASAAPNPAPATSPVTPSNEGSTEAARSSASRGPAFEVGPEDLRAARRAFLSRTRTRASMPRAQGFPGPR